MVLCVLFFALLVWLFILNSRLKNLEQKNEIICKTLEALRSRDEEEKSSENPKPAIPEKVAVSAPALKNAFPQQNQSVQFDGDFLLEKLRAWKILSPKEMPFEFALMRWWAPRVGGILALLSVIFFGVWASQFSSPLSRILGMTLLALAFVGTGLFFRRRGNVVLDEPLCSTGATMFYLTALAAGTFEPTKIIESIPLALSVQLLAILPMFLLGRARIVSQHLVLVFAFVSAMFAVLNGSGVLALITAAFAYLVAVLFCYKTKANSVLLTGALGAWLPLFAMPFSQLPDKSSPSSVLTFWEVLDYSQFWVCLLFFVFSILLPYLILFFKKEDDRFVRIVLALNVALGFAALCCATLRTDVGLNLFDHYFRASALTTMAGTALSLAIFTFIFWRQNKFAYQCFFVAGTLAAFCVPFEFYYFYEGNFEPCFYITLVGILFVAWAGRETKIKSAAIPLFIGFGFSSQMSTSSPQEEILACFVGASAFAWFLGDAQLWSGKIFSKIALGVGGFIGFVTAAVFCERIKEIFDFEHTISPSNDALVALSLVAVILVALAGTYWRSLAKTPLLMIAGTLSIFILSGALVKENSHEIFYWLGTTLLAIIAVPACRRFPKKEIFETIFVAHALVVNARIFSDPKSFFGVQPIVVAALPWIAILAGTPWAKRFPLAQRSADIAALPMLVAFFAFPWTNHFAANLIAPLILSVIFVPIVVPAMRHFWRERPWIPVSISVVGSACLLRWGFEIVPQFLTAEAAILALLLIFSGIFAKLKALRFVGIVLLAGTLLRLFVFDIEDNFWRIVVFAVVALVLFLLAYFYSKFNKN